MCPEPVGRCKHHGNEQSASCAIHYTPGLIHTASMLLMIVNAGVPLLNLHQAGANAAGAQPEWHWPWWAMALTVLPLAAPALLAYRLPARSWQEQGATLDSSGHAQHPGGTTK